MTVPYAPIDLREVAQGQGGLVIHGERRDDHSGRSVASAGDINGDGFDDLVIGAADAGGPGDTRDFAGASYVLFGRADGYPAEVGLGQVAQGRGGFVIHGEEAGDRCGVSVGSAGDVNGDGFGDLLIGAGNADGPGQTGNFGAAYVVFGQADGFGLEVDLGEVAQGRGGFVVRGADLGDVEDRSMASAGDLNGDGFDDLVVGANRTSGPDGTRLYAGASYVVFGQAGGFGTEVDLREVAQGRGGFLIRGEDPYDLSGWSVASAGDLNSDGFDDLVIGARTADGPGDTRPYAGASYVVFGQADGFGAEVDLREVAQGRGGCVIHGEDVGDAAGSAVASAGDVNGDGFDDLIIGANSADGPGDTRSSAGAGYVVFGGGEALGAAVDLRDVAEGRGGFVVQGEDLGDGAGSVVASAGDLNGDGFDDLLIGAYRADGPADTRGEAGASYVIFGGGFQPGPAFTADDDSLLGGAQADYLQGGAGRDTLRGGVAADTLSGGGGSDVLFSAGNGEVLSGGGGADLFAFGAFFVRGSIARILDFDRAEGDRILLGRLDADLATPEDDAFTPIGAAGFGGTAGELRWEDLGRGLQRIEGDVDGDGLADGAIVLVDAAPVQAEWFGL